MASTGKKEWKVYFNGNFWGHEKRERAGKEIRINRQFEWGNRHWIIPAVYSCGRGLVVDFCMRVDEEEVLAFIRKWKLTGEKDTPEKFTREEQIEIESENPLTFEFKPYMEINGKIIEFSHGCSAGYHTSLPDWLGNDLEGGAAAEHYGLDHSCGWMIYRYAFSWANKRRPEIKTLSVVMEQYPEEIPGPHFKVHDPGDTFSFVHPLNNMEYTLTVEKLEKVVLPEKCIRSGRWIYPSHFVSMSYTLFPETERRIAVIDCKESDQPVREESDDLQDLCEKNAESTEIIGRADGPTSIVIGGNEEQGFRTAHSALHFEPVKEEIEWRIGFFEKRFQNETIKLI